MTWKTIQLGDAITLKRGFDLPASKREKGRIPIYSSSGKSGTHSTAMVDGPGVVTGRYGTIGKVFYSNDSFWPLNTTLYVADFKENIPRFVFYLLESIKWENYTTASAVPGINRNHVHRCEVNLPDLDTQSRIAMVLGDLDDQIDNLKRTNGYLAA